MISEFFLCIAQYLLIMVILAAIGACGAFIGIRLRKSKNAIEATEETVAEENLEEE